MIFFFLLILSNCVYRFCCFDLFFNYKNFAFEIIGDKQCVSQILNRGFRRIDLVNGNNKESSCKMCFFCRNPRVAIWSTKLLQILHSFNINFTRSKTWKTVHRFKIFVLIFPWFAGKFTEFQISIFLIISDFQHHCDKIRKLSSFLSFLSLYSLHLKIRKIYITIHRKLSFSTAFYQPLARITLDVSL